MDNEKQAAAKRLKQAIQASGKTQARAADEIGVCKCQLNRWALGRKHPTKVYRIMINKFFKPRIYND